MSKQREQSDEIDIEARATVKKTTDRITHELYLTLRNKGPDIQVVQNCRYQPIKRNLKIDGADYIPALNHLPIQKNFQCVKLFNHLNFEKKNIKANGWCFYSAVVECLRHNNLIQRLNNVDEELLPENRRNIYILITQFLSVIEIFNKKPDFVPQGLDRETLERMKKKLENAKKNIDKEELPTDCWGSSDMLSLLAAFTFYKFRHAFIFLIVSDHQQTVTIYNFNTIKNIYSKDMIYKEFMLGDLIALYHTGNHYDSIFPLRCNREFSAGLIPTFDR